jgi:2-isopropylmalate synthase
MLKDARTYEIMRPQDVGQMPEQLVLGRHSGRHAVQKRCETLGLPLTTDELAKVYHAVITMGEHRKSIGDGDLRRIVERVRSGDSSATAPRQETVGYGRK